MDAAQVIKFAYPGITGKQLQNQFKVVFRINSLNPNQYSFRVNFCLHPSTLVSLSFMSVQTMRQPLNITNRFGMRLMKYLIVSAWSTQCIQLPHYSIGERFV